MWGMNQTHRSTRPRQQPEGSLFSLSWYGSTAVPVRLSPDGRGGGLLQPGRLPARRRLVVPPPPPPDELKVDLAEAPDWPLRLRAALPMPLPLSIWHRAAAAPGEREGLVLRTADPVYQGRRLCAGVIPEEHLAAVQDLLRRHPSAVCRLVAAERHPQSCEVRLTVTISAPETARVTAPCSGAAAAA